MVDVFNSRTFGKQEIVLALIIPLHRTKHYNERCRISSRHSNNYAVAWGHVTIVRLLLEKRADPNLCVNVCTVNHATIDIDFAMNL